jgi:hypothetical protein
MPSVNRIRGRAVPAAEIDFLTDCDNAIENGGALTTGCSMQCTGQLSVTLHRVIGLTDATNLHRRRHRDLWWKLVTVCL